MAKKQSRETYLMSEYARVYRILPNLYPQPTTTKYKPVTDDFSVQSDPVLLKQSAHINMETL